MKKIFPILTCILAFNSCQKEPNRNEQESVILNIAAISNKSPEEVTKIIGVPDSVYYQKRGKKNIGVHLYHPHKIEIYFLERKATEIIVNEPAPLPYNKEALAHFNIDPIAPDKGNNNVALKWTNIEGFRFINFFAIAYKGDSVTNYKMFFNLNTDL